jgi:hypothetical protein
MTLDFFSDLVDELQRLLKDADLAVPTFEQLRLQYKRSEEIKSKIKDYDLHNLLLHCFTVYSRRIPVIKWNVHTSSELEGRSEINEIINKLENGVDVNRLLSNKVRKLNQVKNADLLKSEWGIYHLHFREERSEELLFIYLSEGNAYLLDILKHEKADGSVVTWTNTDLIQTIHDNWPHVIKPFIYKTNSTAPILSTEQRRALRKNAGNTNVVLHDGTEYMPIGFGFSSSKHPTSAVIQSAHLLFKVRNLQATVKENYQSIKQALVEHTTEPVIKLKIDDNFQPFVVESKKHILLKLEPSEENA